MTPYTTASSESRGLPSYLEIPLRRPLHVLVPLVVSTLVALLLALNVQSRYRTSTLILVESQKRPESFVQEERASERPRLLTVRQEILSRTRLERVIEEVNPYPEMTGKVPLTQIIETMRSAASINVRGEDAFTLEFVHSDPKIAQAAANRLASLFIEETTRARAEQVTGTASFIETQLEEARSQLERKESDVRRYKEAHMGRLPEQTGANLATLQRLQLEQQSLASTLQSARQRLMLLEQGAVDPPGWPGASTAAPAPDDPGALLAGLRGQLLALRERYTDEHPDVRALEARIAQLERQIARAKSAPPDQKDVPPTAAFLRLREAQLEIDNLEAKVADVERRIQLFQQRVEQAPLAEQELTTLTRDHQKLNENYLNLLNRKIDAQMAEKLEQRWKGEQFRILDPAYLPEEPYFPNRMLFLVIGMTLGLGAGIAAAVIADFLDSSVKGPGDLEVLAPLPVLARIPDIAGGARSRKSGQHGSLLDIRRILAARVLGANDKAAEEHLLDALEGSSDTVGSMPVFEDAHRVRARPQTVVAEALLGPSLAAEEFRTLAARVRTLDSDRRLRCIGIVSAVVGEGKSSVASGLASALAQSTRVLLIEADLRRSALEGYLGLSPFTGVSEWLAKGVGSLPIRQVTPPGFFVLTAGQKVDPYAKLAFSSKTEMVRMKALLDGSRGHFDYVLVDCPPLVPVADAVILQELLDGFLVVVRERYAPLETITQALDRLKPDLLRGIVLNDHLEVLPRYRRYQSEYYRQRA